MMFAPSENQTCPKSTQPQEMQEGGETEAQSGSVATANVLGLSQGLSTGPFTTSSTHCSTASVKTFLSNI